jgi:hypothetical protein
MQINPMQKSFLKKLIVPHLTKKFSAHYGIRGFITVLTRARHQSFSCTTVMQSMHSLPIAFRFNLILFCNQRLGLPRSFVTYAGPVCVRACVRACTRVSHSFEECGYIFTKFQIVMTLTINITILLNATCILVEY